jgi:hypothetical protein
MKVKNLNGKKAVKPDEKLLPKVAARKISDELGKLFHAAEKSLVQAAILLDKFIRGQGWKALGYKTMTLWREKEIPFSDFYNYRNAMKLLEAGVPAEQVEKIPLTNMNVITRQLPESKWSDPKLLKAAEGPVKEFERQISEKESETKAEEILRRGFAGPKSLIEKWDLAMKVAEFIDHAEGQEAKIEAVVTEYLNGAYEEEGKSRLQAYEEKFAVPADLE